MRRSSREHCTSSFWQLTATAEAIAIESLPIDAHLPAITAALETRGVVVVVAEPGAGKTTRVPAALARASFLANGEILVLEPRRLAARLSAERVASELGEKIGKTVGYTIRFESVASESTRVRFVTEGVLTRRISRDPELRGVSCLILDEFHERSLHTDLAIAWARRLRSEKRPDLRVVVMSATIDAESVAKFLDATTIQVPGRTFPVTIEHLERADTRPLEQVVAMGVRRALDKMPDGDVLCFLPGSREIRRAEEALRESLRARGVELAILHGDLPAADQDRAVRAGTTRRVILSTNIAETSLTLPSVTSVVDSGFARRAGFSPWSGLPTLETQSISRASATQRAGRAGRVREGYALRLYTAPDFQQRPSFDVPEIMRADITELTLIVHAAAAADIGWFESPLPAALEASRRLLRALGALDEAGVITEVGKKLLELGAHPRIGRVLLESAERGVAARGALMAALMGERDVDREERTSFGGAGTGKRAPHVSVVSDVIERVERFEAWEWGGGSPESHGLDKRAVFNVRDARNAFVRALTRAVRSASPDAKKSLDEEESDLRRSLFSGFADRAAQRRVRGGSDFVVALGGAVNQGRSSVLDAEFVVVLDAEEQRGDRNAKLLSQIDPDWLLEGDPSLVIDEARFDIDEKNGKVFRTTSLRYGALTLDSSRAPAQPGPETARALLEWIVVRDYRPVVDMDALHRLRNRATFAVANGATFNVEETVQAALAEATTHAVTLDEVKRADPLALAGMKLGSTLERFAPETVLIGKRKTRVNYDAGKPPWVESRMQDFFGMKTGPVVGNTPVVLHLLAPNQRAVQVTTDLAGFWTKHYPSIRKELMRKYPRHQWPENPR